MKKIGIISALLLLLFTLVGCNTDFDAKGYVQGVLDKTYKADYDLYRKMVDATEEECEQDYKDGMSAEVDFFLQYYVGGNVSDDVHNEIAQMYEKIYKKAKYVVEKPTLTEANTYEISIHVSPINVFILAEDKIDSLLEDMQSDENYNIYGKMDEIEFCDTLSRGIIAIINEELPNLSYEDVKTIDTVIKQDADGLFTLNHDDFIKIDSYIIAY